MYPTTTQWARWTVDVALLAFGRAGAAAAARSEAHADAPGQYREWSAGLKEYPPETRAAVGGLSTRMRLTG